MDNQIQIQLKLMTGETEIIANEDKEECGKIINQVISGGWVAIKDNGKLRHINGNYVVKIIVKQIEGREVIRKNG